MPLSLILVMLQQSVFSVCSPDEFIVVDGDTDEEFGFCKHAKKKKKKKEKKKRGIDYISSVSDLQLYCKLRMQKMKSRERVQLVQIH